jgi:hypothetical protein
MQKAYVVCDADRRIFEAYGNRRSADGLLVDLRDVGIRASVREVPMTDRLYDIIVSCENPITYQGPYPELPHEFKGLRSYTINTPTR